MKFLEAALAVLAILPLVTTLINSIVACFDFWVCTCLYLSQLLRTARKMWEMMLNSQDHHEAGT